MSDVPENLVLRYLRGLDTKVDRLVDDMRELKGRVGVLDERYASVSPRLDSIELRMERIERRLHLIDEHTT